MRNQIIIDAHASGVSLSDLAKQFNISYARVWQIVKKAAWKRVQKDVPSDSIHSLPIAYKNILLNSGLVSTAATASDIAMIDPNALLRVKQCGPKTVNKVEEFLKANGLSFAVPLRKNQPRSSGFKMNPEDHIRIIDVKRRGDKLHFSILISDDAVDLLVRSGRLRPRDVHDWLAVHKAFQNAVSERLSAHRKAPPQPRG